MCCSVGLTLLIKRQRPRLALNTHCTSPMTSSPGFTVCPDSGPRVVPQAKGAISVFFSPLWVFQVCLTSPDSFYISKVSFLLPRQSWICYFAVSQLLKNNLYLWFFFFWWIPDTCTRALPVGVCLYSFDQKRKILNDWWLFLSPNKLNKQNVFVFTT